MAITVTKKFRIGEMANRPGIGGFTVSFTTGTAYATNGVTVDISAAVPAGVTFSELQDYPVWATKGFTAEYVPGTTFANGKFKLYVGGTETTNATDLTASFSPVLHGQLIFRTGV